MVTSKVMLVPEQLRVVFYGGINKNIMFYFLLANILCNWAEKNSTGPKAPLWTYLELFVRGIFADHYILKSAKHLTPPPQKKTPLRRLLPKKKVSTYNLRNRTSQYPKVNTDRFKNSYINRLIFKYNLAMWAYFFLL